MTTRRKRQRTEWSPKVTDEEAFRLACAYGLARPPARHYVVPLLHEEEDLPHENAGWIWSQAMREWKGKR